MRGGKKILGIKKSVRMKTDYLDDFRLIADFPALVFTLSFSLLLFSAPIFLSEYVIHIMTHIAIYSVAVLGQNILIGYTGLISFGQAGFLAVGAYTFAHVSKVIFEFLPDSSALSHLLFPLGISVSLFISGLAGAFFGAVVGIPSLRLKGPYLAIATLGFAVAVYQVVQNTPEISGGRMGISIPRVPTLESDAAIYYLSLVSAYIFFVAGYRIVKSHLGRIFLAIRESELAAEALGINTNKYKILSFVISSFFTSFAGGLYAYFMGYLDPTMFNITESILMFSAIIIGGIGTVAGSIFGSAFVISIPQIFIEAREFIPIVFSAAIVLVMIFEPLGLYGRWLKIKLYFMNFPFR